MKNAIKILKVLLITTVVLLSAEGISSAQEGSVHQAAGALFEKALFPEEIRGDLPEAIELYRQLLDKSPNNRQLAAGTLLHMGFCYEKLGSEQEEEVAAASQRMNRLEAYVTELNRKAEQHITNGNAMFKHREYEDAVKEYENAINLRPNSLLAMNTQYCIGQSWYRAGKYEEARATLTDLTEENPRSIIVLVTELMLSQVQYSIENSEQPGTIPPDSDENTIVDPET